jgi:membrane dipeptidase
LYRREFLTRSLVLGIAGSRLLAGRQKYSTRAIDLVAKSNVIDMLGLPTLNWPLLDRWHGAPDTFGDADFQKLRSSGIDVFHPAVAFETNRSPEITRDWFVKWNRLIDAHPEYFVRVDRAEDLTRAKRARKIGIILGMQDSNHLRCLDDLDTFRLMGQRLTQLTYNSQNTVGSGCMAAKDTGLTPFGCQVVARMNAIGMAIDVSHCGPRTTLDAIEASAKPVLITHSNCRALAPGVARCKTDEAIRAAARKGGVIGLTSVRHFVRATDPVTLEDALNHFDYAMKLVGAEHIGIGSDFDLDAHPAYDIPGLNHVERIYALTEGLIRRSYTDRQIELILGVNFQRALEAIWS